MKRYTQKNVVVADIPVLVDPSIKNLYDTRLIIAKKHLGMMVERLEGLGRFDVALLKAKVREGSYHDCTYTQQLTLWCMEEIGRLYELFHAVDTLMSGKAGAGFPLPKNVVFLGDEPQPKGPSVTVNTTAPTSNVPCEPTYIMPQPQGQQTYYATPNGYYESSGFTPQYPDYQQEQPQPGVLPYGTSHWDSAITSLLPAKRQLDHCRSRTRRMSLGGEKDAMDNTSVVAARSRSLEPVGQQRATRVGNVQHERIGGWDLEGKRCNLKLSTADAPKGPIDGPSVKRARPGTSPTARSSNTSYSSSSSLAQLFTTSGAYTLTSALRRLTAGPSSSKSSAIALDCGVTSLEGGGVLQSTEDCERIKQSWRVDDSKPNAERATTTQTRDPNDEQTAQRQLSEEIPRTNAKPTLTSFHGLPGSEPTYESTQDIEEQLMQRLSELGAEMDQQSHREFHEYEQRSTESESTRAARESRTTSSKKAINAQPENTDLVQEKTDLATHIARQSGLIINLTDLQFVRNLGEGAYGHVMLATDCRNPEVAVAVKCVDLFMEDTDVAETVLNETLLQHTLRNHDNVLKCIGMRVAGWKKFQLITEYADGGELFDYIIPDVGMPPSMAYYYFKQLIYGLEYIHSKGIAHRDITLEKLLLTRKNVLKISDFGTATIFEPEGKEFYLNIKFVTVSYAAPEVFTGRHRGIGAPIDIWSSGVVLVALLTGELPWEQPSDDCQMYQKWVHTKHSTCRPWSKMGTLELSLLKEMLCVDVEKRATVNDIKGHPWFTQYKLETLPGRPLRHGVFKRPTKIDGTAVRGISFTHPENTDTSLVTAQYAESQSVSQTYHINALQKLARRKTRFCVKVTVSEAIKVVADACSQLGYTSRPIAAHQLMVSSSCGTRDLSFLVTVYEVHDIGYKKVLVDFRRSRGDGLEFKRNILSLGNELKQIVCDDSSKWLERQGLF